MRILVALLVASTVFADEPPLAEEQGLTDFRGILHCHGHYSHDSKGTDEELVTAAREAGIDFIFMTDHPSPGSVTENLRGMHGDTLFFPGAETHQLLACDLQKPVEEANGTQEAIDLVLAQKGLAFIAHPEEEKDWDALERFTGMEIYNLHADIKDETPATLLRKLLSLRGSQEWLYTTFFNVPKENLARFDEIGQHRRVVGVAGDDAHQNQKYLGIQFDPYARTFRFVQTHVFAEGLDHDAITRNLAEGHAYVSFGIFGETEGFSFTANVGDRDVIMGDEAKFEEGASLRMKVPAPTEVRILRDGKPWKRRDALDWTVAADGPGVYRVEVWTHQRGKDWPWVYSNPIYLRK